MLLDPIFGEVFIFLASEARIVRLLEMLLIPSSFLVRT